MTWQFIVSLIGLFVYTPTLAADGLYVSPDGQDGWTGRYPAPNESKTDGPIRTLQRALDRMAELRSGTPQAAGTIYLREGLYSLQSPIVIAQRHSGIVITAYQSERPVVSGGRLIVGWQQTDINGKKAWMTELADVRAGKWSFRQLWVNGRRAVRSRHPNNGYLRIAGIPDVDQQTPWQQGQMRFRFKEGDLQCLDGIQGAGLIVMNRWTESHLPIVSIDQKERIVQLGRRSVFRLEPEDPYYLENALAFLDRPGEWCLDMQAGRLYYIPLANEDMETAQVIAPYLTQLVQIQAEISQGQWVEKVVWKNLTFAHTEWYFGPEFKPTWPSSDIGGFPQAAIGVPGTIYGEGLRYCTFEACTFTHIGNYCLELSAGCQSNTINRCIFSDIGAGAIKIGQQQAVDDRPRQTFGNRVTNCTISDAGRLFHSAVGIWIGQSYDNLIANNEIFDLYYTGISIGWTWGYGRSLASGNIVEFNHVHHIGRRTDGDGPILSDMGGIYTLGIQDRTIIRNNLWHDIAGLRYGGWGIYLDEGSSNILVENNLVYNTTHGGFHQHYGRDNTIRNNIFYNGRDHQIQATRSEEHLRFTFVGNIVIGRTEQWLAGAVDKNLKFCRNLYWREGGGPIRFGDLSWQQWQQLGMDTDSIIADPQFLDPASRDFRLRQDSPAFKVGFKQFDLNRVGPQIH